MLVRPGTAADYPAIERVLAESPQAASWLPDGYEFFVVEPGSSVAGFLVWRWTAPDEIEILNLAVENSQRRTGCATALLAGLPKALVFLEVRESNTAARALYRAAGFAEVGTRPGYYRHPDEGAIVMRLQS